MNVREILALLKQTALEWLDDKTFQLGAALAYYSVFSLAPVLVIAIAIAGFIFGESAVKDQLVHQLEPMVGNRVAQAIQDVLGYVQQSGSGVLATAFSAAAILFGALGVFGQLQEALNMIWKVKPKPDRGILGMVKDRALQFLMVLCIGAVILSLMVLNATLTTLEHLFGGVGAWQQVNLFVTFLSLTLLVALTFKILPDVDMPWRNVWIGSVLTGLLLVIGNWLIGLYLTYSSVASAYGAAGSVVVILLWVYYSSQILLFGAEFTHVYTTRYHLPVVPAENAEPVTAEDRLGHGLAPAR
jgi:membrane protein